MSYQITVLKDDRHFFLVDERSTPYIDDFQRILKELHKRFPKSEGFTFEGTRWKTRSGEILNIEEVTDEMEVE